MSDSTLNNTAEAKRRWFEPASAALMALAKLGSAWCSYQSSRWSDQNDGHADTRNHLDRRALALHREANQTKIADMGLFEQWLTAHLSGQQVVATFYERRFPQNLRNAHTAWLAEKPFENESTDPTPFSQNLYKLQLATDAEEANHESARHSQIADDAERYGDSYLLNTLPLATVLFFAGTAASFDKRCVRQSTLAFGLALFLYAAAITISRPIT